MLYLGSEKGMIFRQLNKILGHSQGLWNQFFPKKINSVLLHNTTKTTNKTSTIYINGKGRNCCSTEKYARCLLFSLLVTSQFTLVLLN